MPLLSCELLRFPDIMLGLMSCPDLTQVQRRLLGKLGLNPARHTSHSHIDGLAGVTWHGGQSPSIQYSMLVVSHTIGVNACKVS